MGLSWMAGSVDGSKYVNDLLGGIIGDNRRGALRKTKSWRKRKTIGQMKIRVESEVVE